MSQFDFEEPSVSARPPAKSGMSPMTIAAGLVAIGVLGAGGVWWLAGKPAKLTLNPIESQTVEEGLAISVPLKVQAEGLNPGEWVFGIVEGPPGARIDAKAGAFLWKPEEEHGPGQHKVTVGVQAKGGKSASDKQSFHITVNEVNQPPVIQKVDPPSVVAGEQLRFSVKATDPDRPAQALTYRLKDAPQGASINAKSGELIWSTAESIAAGPQIIEVVVSDAAAGEATSRITVQVEPAASPLAQLLSSLRTAGLVVENSVGVAPPGFKGVASHYAVGEEDSFTVLEYETAEQAKLDAEQVTEAGQMLFGEPAEWKTKTSLHRKDRLIALYGGASSQISKSLSAKFGEPFVTAEASQMKPKPVKPVEKTVAEKLVDALAKLHDEQNLTGKKDYPGVRKLFADFYEQQNEFMLSKLGEGDGAEFKKWLDEHVDFKEEFFVAIAPEDDPTAAFKILQALHRKFPTKLNDYGQLAIAIALTWDNQGNVDHYDDHQRRTHSVMPSGMLGAVENFEYFIDTTGIMQGRAQFLPWEFLIYLVNHKTPRVEREWAAANYVPKRTMYGKCYADVPYDNEMLRTESRVCKLDGKDYSLPNIRQFGGVCAMQADFAARVGKSIGVPAEYVAGEAAGGELHAWVMWVEVKQVSRSGISFALESHGRYRGDKYYVGTLRDPQTGRGITDRELELRLQGVGLSPVAFHHAKLVMQAYPQLRDKLGWKPAQEIAFLNDVIELCPGNEEAWKQVAQLARDGRIGADSNRQMTAMFDKLFRTFANFPDFTWKVFDDLVQYQKNPKQRNKYYERLVQMYEVGGRPDLACEARLRLSDYLMEENHAKEVIDGLAFTIKKFPDEGRYVPKLLDRLEQVCAGVKGADQQVLRFYQEFIPMIPQKRGNDPSPYCMRMLERAIDKFKTAGQVQQAQVYAAQLATLKASGE